jgi:hypothetical protein
MVLLIVFPGDCDNELTRDYVKLRGPCLFIIVRSHLLILAKAGVDYVLQAVQNSNLVKSRQSRRLVDEGGHGKTLGEHSDLT